jgi:hypothetical protein
VALGGALELAMACDIRIAAETARFGLPEVSLGVLPGAGGTQRLVRLVGPGRAIKLIVTGRAAAAAEALETGLVTSVVPAAQLMDAAREMAGHILAEGPLAVRLAKLVIRAGMNLDLRTGQVVERLAQGLLYVSDDKRKGTEAFLGARRGSPGPEYGEQGMVASGWLRQAPLALEAASGTAVRQGIRPAQLVGRAARARSPSDRASPPRAHDCTAKAHGTGSQSARG